MTLYFACHIRLPVAKILDSTKALFAPKFRCVPLSLDNWGWPKVTPSANLPSMRLLMVQARHAVFLLEPQKATSTFAAKDTELRNHHPAEPEPSLSLGILDDTPLSPMVISMIPRSREAKMRNIC